MWGHKPRKVDAVGIMTEADGRVSERNIKRCCHCGGYWDMQPGSGNIRGFCFKCMDEFCGPGCCDCVPLEKRLESESKAAQNYFVIENEKWLERVYKQVEAGKNPTENDLCLMSTTSQIQTIQAPAPLSAIRKAPTGIAT